MKINELARNFTRTAISAGSALVIAAATLSIVIAPSPAVANESDCRDIEFTATNVPLVVSTPATVRGTLCAGSQDQVVHLLVPGATYNRSYWDFPYQPEKYSYVDAMRNADIATLNIDRLGTGESARPLSPEISILSDAEVVRQLVAALRNGSLGQSFDKVILAGHSLGTLVSMAALVPNPTIVDGFIPTGISRGFDLVGFPQALINLMHPAFLEGGRFANLDPGYITTNPGSRESLFYHSPTADPQVIAHDEATKEPQSVTQIGGIALPLITTLTFTMPVLNVLGEYDAVFCKIIACTSPLNLWNSERLLYPQVSNYESLTVPDTGHDINLHPNGKLFFDKAIEWTHSIT